LPAAGSAEKKHGRAHVIVGRRNPGFPAPEESAALQLGDQLVRCDATEGNAADRLCEIPRRGNPVADSLDGDFVFGGPERCGAAGKDPTADLPQVGSEFSGHRLPRELAGDRDRGGTAFSEGAGEHPKELFPLVPATDYLDQLLGCDHQIKFAGTQARIQHICHPGGGAGGGEPVEIGDKPGVGIEPGDTGRNAGNVVGDPADAGTEIEHPPPLAETGPEWKVGAVSARLNELPD